MAHSSTFSVSLIITRKNRFRHRHLIFRERGHIIAVWPGAFRDEDGLNSWTSHPGASYGGLIVKPGLGIREAHDIVLQLIDVAKDQGIERLRCTPPPLIYHRYPADTVEFTLVRAGFTYLKQDYTQAVDLSRLPVDEADVIAQYNNKTRTAIRKAIRDGVEVKHDLSIIGKSLADFYDILVSNRARLGVTPTHSAEELEKLNQLAPKYLDLALAYYEDKPIAGILNFVCNEHVMLEFYIAHRAEAQSLRPVPLLIHETVLRTQRRGFRWLDFGISTEWGNKVTWGLAAFKENFPVQGFFRNTLYLDDVQNWQPSDVFLPPSNRIRSDVR